MPDSMVREDSLEQQGPQECMSPSSYLGMKYSTSPRTVSVPHRTELVSPLMLGEQKSYEDLNLELGRSPRRPSVRSPGSHRLSGRLPSKISSESLIPMTPIFDGSSNNEERENPIAEDRHSHHDLDALIDQVTAWIRDEKNKRSRRKSKKKGLPQTKSDSKHSPQQLTDDADGSSKRRPSDASDNAPDLDGLEHILRESLSLARFKGRKSATSLRHKLSRKKFQRKPSAISSDTEYLDNEILVPSCDAILDNSKTLAYSGGASDPDDSSSDELNRFSSYRDRDAWAQFKFEIVRLVHTLRLKGWSRVPLDMSGNITVQRLSGALTNAVYVVEPPSDLPQKKRQETDDVNPAPKRAPPKLLLRIYGPQVEHLIDRESELAILQRLARKRIGPRLLGTFANGRFEEFFHAKTLTSEDLRNPDTSRQIAKRMRELHEGIDLLAKEREDGAFVWRNWDKWVLRVERVVSWLDEQVMMLDPGVKPTGDEAWKRRGFICGVPWKQFRDMVEKYRSWLNDQYGGLQKVSEQLVFAHNDTQYGNILRLMPTGDSPLLLPANTHKQLVVIDFEYASANLPGQEFANHFTEWCYNYHDKRKPYACNTTRYPTPEEQERFIRAYVRHRPQFNVSTPKLGPKDTPATATAADTPVETLPSRRPTTNISDFMLDARGPHLPPASPNPAVDDAAGLAREDAEVARLLRETRLWRLANTAQWVAWGIVQAKVPGMPDFASAAAAASGKSDAERMEAIAEEELAERAETYREAARGDAPGAEPDKREEVEEEEEEFDYLGYAQHRAMFFWGDALQLGLATPEDLPAEVRDKVKTVAA